MRKLIRCKSTNAFLTDAGTWTQDACAAAEFPDHFRACAVMRELQLDNIELYYLFGDVPDPQYDFAVPLH